MDAFELNNVERDLLFVVARFDGASGTDIRDTLETTQGRRVLSGRVYSNLDSLVERGLVAKERIDGRTNSYVVTDAGAEALRTLYRWQRPYLSERPRQ